MSDDDLSALFRTLRKCESERTAAVHSAESLQVLVNDQAAVIKAKDEEILRLKKMLVRQGVSEWTIEQL